MIKRLTLCLVHQPPRLLLGMKKRGFGMGKWNGFGGKVMEGEAVEHAARRELQEEVGIIAEQMERVGVLEFVYSQSPDVMEVHLFRMDRYSGEPVETDEMRPQWFLVNQLPFDDMWADDRFWMPLFLAGKKFKGRFRFDESNAILESALTEVEGF